MSDKKDNSTQLRDELLSGDVPDLKHVETVVRQGTMTTVLQCPSCKKEVPFPSHCGEPMELEGSEFVCTNSECSEKVPLPDCCGDNLRVAIKQL